MRIKKIIILTASIVTLLFLTGCADKEQKYVSIENPEKYFVIDGENYTYYTGKEDEIETGKIIKNDDDTSISFINSETDETRTFDNNKNFFGSHMFDIDKSEVFDGGKRFSFEATYGPGKMSVYGMNFDFTYNIELSLDGTFTEYRNSSETYCVGTYSVDGHVVTLDGIEEIKYFNGSGSTTTDYSEIWYYDDYSFYGSAYVKE